MDIYREQFHDIQDKMRLTVLKSSGTDRLTMKFAMSSNTRNDMSAWYEQEEYERVEVARAEQRSFVDKAMDQEKPESLFSFVMNKITGNLTQYERRAAVNQAHKIKSYVPKDIGFISHFMGRPIEIDETIPYGEFKTNL